MEYNDNLIKILLIEDDPGDARLIQEMIKDIGSEKFTLFHVQTLKDGLDKLNEENFNVILLDLLLPDSMELQTLYRLTSAAKDMPIIVLTGIASEDIGIKAINEGAQDYLIKDQVNSNLLIRSINYSIERNRLMVNLKQSYQRDLESLKSITKQYQSIIMGTKTTLDNKGLLDSDISDKLTEQYQKIVIKYIRSLRIKSDRPVQQIKQLANSLSNYNATAKAVVQLHIRVLDEFSNLAFQSEEKEFSNDARLALVELMGNLLDIYRSKFLTTQI